MFCLVEQADFQRNLTPVARGPACLDKFHAKRLGGVAEILLHLRKPDDCLLSGAEHCQNCVGRLCSRHETSFTSRPHTASDHDPTRRKKNPFDPYTISSSSLGSNWLNFFIPLCSLEIWNSCPLLSIAARQTVNHYIIALGMLQTPGTESCMNHSLIDLIRCPLTNTTGYLTCSLSNETRELVLPLRISVFLHLGQKRANNLTND